MRSDLDQLMRNMDLDALLIKGAASHNSAMVYFTGMVHMSDGFVLKRRDHPAVVFCNPMEREEAARSGLPVKNLADYKPMQLLRAANGDAVRAGTALLRLILEEYTVKGRVAIYGHTDLGPTYASYRQLEAEMEGLQLVGENRHDSTLAMARSTKDADELERIRQMGLVTTAVIGDVAQFLSSHRARGAVLVNSQDQVLTIGEVKKRINLWLAMRGAENPKGTIFSAGRDAGIPHSTGRDQDPVPVGVPIIFDLFPCEQGGGYFYDFTRTWAIGFASDELLELYDDVSSTYQAMLQSFKPGTRTRDYQIRTCELFAERGHATVLEHPETENGYVHSLGHGLGLDVHEAPFFSQLESNRATLEVGSVFTCEPGLYYPERGMGVRLEDTLFINQQGEAEVFVDYPHDLVLKVAGV